MTAVHRPPSLAAGLSLDLMHALIVSMPSLGSLAAASVPGGIAAIHFGQPKFGSYCLVA